MESLQSIGRVPDAPEFDRRLLWRFRGASFIDLPIVSGVAKSALASKNYPTDVILAARDVDGILDWQTVSQSPSPLPKEIAQSQNALRLGARDGVTLTLRLRNQLIHVWEIGRNIPTRNSLSRDAAINLTGSLHYTSCLLEEAQPAVPALSILTSREIEVLNLCKVGHSYASAGMTLQISPKTVEYHVANAMRKLGTKDRLPAILQAIRLGLLDI